MSKLKNLDVDAISFEQILEEKCSKRDLVEGFYTFFSHTVQNFSTSTRSMYEVSTEELLMFIANILHIKPKERESLDKDARSLKPLPYLLTVEVIEGIDLIPTDADSLSDPYCKLWISSNPKHTERTLTKENTRDPEWNEKYEFRVKNVKKDVLHLQIWDEDSTSIVETLREIRTVSGIRGCCLFCKDLMEVIIPCVNTDDFMGWAKVDIKSIFPEGRDLCLVLESKRGARIRGSLHISTSFEINVPENEPRAVKLHLFLCRLCLIDSLSKKKCDPLKCESWDDFLSETAEAFLYVHGVQCNISKMAYAVCQWLVVNSHFCKGVLFSFKLLFKLLRQVQIQQKSDSSSGYLKDVFSESLKKFTPKCVSMLHHKNMTGYLESEENAVELEYVLRSLVALQEEMKDEIPDPLKILEEESLLWYKQEFGAVLRSENISDVSKGIARLLRTLVFMHKIADQVIRRIFPKLTYTEITLHQIHFVVTNVLQPAITEAVQMPLKANDDVKSRQIEECLDIYVALRSFCDFVKPFESSENTSDLQNFRDWFPVSVVTNWFGWYEKEVSSTLAEWMVSKALAELNYNDHPNDMIPVKQDPSVGIIEGLIKSKLCHLWDVIDWPIPEYIEAFLKGINDCCIKYCALLTDKMSQLQLIKKYNTEGRAKLPVIANSIWALAQQIDLIKSSRLTGISSELPDTKCELEEKCESVCSVIANEVRTEFLKHIEEISIAKVESIQEKVIQEYRHFVVKCLDFYSQSMARAVFMHFLRKLWDHIITIFSEITAAAIEKNWCLKLKKLLQIDLLLFRGMIKSLELTKLLFLSSFSGDHENLNTTAYEKILKDLEDYSF